MPVTFAAMSAVCLAISCVTVYFTVPMETMNATAVSNYRELLLSVIKQSYNNDNNIVIRTKYNALILAEHLDV